VRSDMIAANAMACSSCWIAETAWKLKSPPTLKFKCYAATQPQSQCSLVHNDDLQALLQVLLIPFPNLLTQPFPFFLQLSSFLCRFFPPICITISSTNLTANNFWRSLLFHSLLVLSRQLMNITTVFMFSLIDVTTHH